MNRSADKKTAFVTGASYGVGAATALALAGHGFDVAVSATRAENLDGTVAQLKALGVQPVVLVLDLGSQSSIERAMADVASAFGRLDLLADCGCVFTGGDVGPFAPYLPSGAYL